MLSDLPGGRLNNYPGLCIYHQERARQEEGAGGDGKRSLRYTQGMIAPYHWGNYEKVGETEAKSENTTCLQIIYAF